MANNAGRQGGGGQNMNSNDHVEFTVKAEEDLYLTGSENTILRVSAETNYSCLMLKTQRFSSLFRHYAKYHGLRKDDLEFYFVNPLENEDTPESVQLQRSDTIMVRKRRKPEPPEAAADDDEFFKDMRELLDDEEYMDTVFLVHPDGHPSKTSIIGQSFVTKASSSSKQGVSFNSKKYLNDDDDSFNTKSDGDCDDDNSMNIEPSKPSSSLVKSKVEPDETLVKIRAHKCVLTARAEYFKAYFRKHGTTTSISAPNQKSSSEYSSVSKLGFKESTDCIIDVDPTFSPDIIRMMLEFLYTNRIQALDTTSLDQLLDLLHLSDFWILRDLKRLVEHELIRSHINVNTVARVYCATADHNASRLSRACIEFIMENIREVTGNATFKQEMSHYPHLLLPILQDIADKLPEPVNKKQRLNDHGSSSAATVGATAVGSTPSGAVSSPVPDSDA